MRWFATVSVTFLVGIQFSVSPIGSRFPLGCVRGGLRGIILSSSLGFAWSAEKVLHRVNRLCHDAKQMVPDERNERAAKKADNYRYPLRGLIRSHLAMTLAESRIAQRA